MSPRTIANDFHYFIGTLFFGLFAIVLVSAPGGSPTVAAALTRAGLSALLLALSVYVFRSGEAARGTERLVRQPVIVQPDFRRQRNRTSGSRAA